jgi:membrane protease subunit HflK
MPWNDNKDEKYDDSPWGKRSEKPSPSPSQEELLNLLKNHQNKFKRFFGSQAPKKPNKLFAMVFFIIATLWLSTGFYTVEEGEQAAVVRFGKFVRIALPGLNYHIPEPIEVIYKKQVERIEREEIGFRSSSTNDANMASRKSAQARNISEESLMLTGDENIVDINFVVQWKINNIEDFIFNISRPKETVKSTAESAMREIIGNTAFAAAQTQARSDVEHNVMKLLQNILDSYRSGIEIVALQMLKIDPPEEVIDAFRDVQTARADKEREINQALSYSNDIIPRARGEAAKITAEAEAYKQEVTSLATGEVSRFNAVYEQYKLAKDVTKKRIYLDTMEQVLSGVNKIIIDKKVSNVMPYLPLNTLEPGKK